MFASLLDGQYDSYQASSSHRLVNSVRSYINAKLEHEQTTPEFVAEVRRVLYFIHEYNCQVLKETHHYPRSRKFDLLLVKYVELEFDALYYNNPHPPRQLEVTTELRVSRVLQVMLYQAVLNNETLVTKSTDYVLKKAVLQLLGEVRSTYLIKNKLVYNIANDLLEKINQPNDNKNFPPWEINKSLATSDYGTDSDSEGENNVFATNVYNSSQEKIPVSQTSGHIYSTPTTEFADDNYFVYLQKQVDNSNFDKLDTKRSSYEVNSNNFNAKYSKSTSVASNNLKKNNSLEAACVIVSSDSEDEEEIAEVLPSDAKVCNKRNSSKKSNECSKKLKTNKSIVTFEILDDDDDDETNYMVYLHKEVKTNKRSKSPKQMKQDDIIICSDSEDELENSTENVLKNGEEDARNSVDQTVPETNDNGISNSELCSDQTLELACAENIEQNNFTEERLNIDEKYKEINEVLQTDLDFIQISSGFCDETSEKFLIDPSLILEQITLPQRNKEEVSDLSLEECGSNILGGPVLSETIDSLEEIELDTSQECRLNDSLLVEVLDDSFLLGRKEFEELEHFLFDDGAEKPGFFLSDFSFDDDDTVTQPATFDADMKSLESILENTQLFNMQSKQTIVSECENCTLTDYKSKDKENFVNVKNKRPIHKRKRKFRTKQRRSRR
ncbi:uncharacterized protein LOC123015134 [Tribolium madens]|uniref:uncharacterized protein LOC123015134 n=1 Tax=Tribolium madens TaxID=41895 RepID=UPI001CF75C35|nr:uncharacterized protein LOC123015134 [Tribolium madens]